MRRSVRGLVFGIAVGLAGALFVVTPLGLAFEERVGLAWLFHLRGSVPPPREAAVVAIDERAAIDLGLPKTPRDWPRALHGQLIDALVERDVDVVVFDLAFTRPQPADADAAFADAIARAGRVLLFESIERRLNSLGPETDQEVIAETFAEPLPQLSRVALGVAPLPLPNVPTRVSRFWTFLGDAEDRMTLPALALMAYGLRHDHGWPVLSPGWEDPLAPPDSAARPTRPTMRIDLMAQALRRHLRADFRPDLLPPPADEQARRVRAAMISLYAAPDSHYLNFYGPPGAIRHVSYARLLACRGRTDPPCDIDLRGRVVFVGLSELAKPPDFARDAFPTVYARPDGVYHSGVEIAATAFANLLTTSTLQPPPIALAFPLVLFLGTVFGVAAARLPPPSAIPSTLLVGLAYTIAAQLLFAHPGLWLPLATPLLGQLPVALVGGIGSQLLRARRQERDLQRAKSAAEAASAAKSEALRMAGHDIRTPVQAMVGYLEQLRATPLDAGQHALLDRVLAASDALVGVLNAVLDLSAIEAGKLRIVDEEVDLRRFAPSVIDMFDADATVKGLDLSLSISPGVPTTIHTDPLRLRQILGNLLANAVKFTDRGRVALNITLTDAASGSPAVVFAVVDTGIGIAADTLAGLFQPFSRGTVNQTSRPGSGLGLSIALRLADLMGGTITVDSRPGRGSTFRLWLPARPAQAADLGFPSATPQPAPVWGMADVGRPPTPLPPPSVTTALVVEDDPAIRALLTQQLGGLGLSVLAAGDGAAAWELLQEASVDILLTDYHLPGVEGPELIRRARADDRLAGLRIIGLSADTAAEAERAFTAAGADAVVTKPATRRQLEQALLGMGVPAADQTGARSQPTPGKPPAPTHDDAPVLSVDDADDDLQRWPIFDAANILEAIGHDRERLHLVTEAYVRQTEPLISHLTQASGDRDAVAVGRLAHRIAGSCLSFGAIRLGEMCRMLERRAGVDDWANIERWVALLPQSFADAAGACRHAVAEANQTDGDAAQRSTSL